MISQCFTLEFTKANILFPWIRRIISYKITNNYCIKYVSLGILLLQQKTWENNPYKEQGLTIDVWLLTKDKKRWLDNAKFFIYIYMFMNWDTRFRITQKEKNRTNPMSSWLNKHGKERIYHYGTIKNTFFLWDIGANSSR